jgi:hypothetical protein
MTRGVSHSPELRAEVVNAVALGMPIREAARQFGLDPTLVSRWAAAGVATIATAKNESDSELIMRYFRAGMRAMITQAEVFGDELYCRAQEADKLAIAHGVLGDKLAGIATTAAALGLIAPATRTLELPDADFDEPGSAGAEPASGPHA